MIKNPSTEKSLVHRWQINLIKNLKAPIFVRVPIETISTNVKFKFDSKIMIRKVIIPIAVVIIMIIIMNRSITIILIVIMMINIIVITIIKSFLIIIIIIKSYD